MKKFYAFFLLFALPLLGWAQGTEVDKSAWSVTYFDSEMVLGSAGGEAPAIWAIDGDINTTWHTEWWPNSVPPPHTIEIDMGSPDRIFCFGFLPRSGDNGRPKDVKIYTKLDPGDAWGLVASGTTQYNDNQQNFYFDAAVDAQYLKLEILNSWSDLNHSAIQEVYAYNPPEVEFAADMNQVFVGDAVKYKGYTSLDNPTWAWSFEGGTPATGSTNSMDVVYNTIGRFDASLTVTSGGTPYPLSKTDYITVTDIKIPRYTWSVIDYSSIDPSGSYPVENALDGLATTFFYTPTAAPFPAFPHHITIDMGKVNPVTALEYTPRASGTNGLIKDWEFWASTDNSSFTKVASGTWAKDNLVKLQFLAAKTDMRYVKLVVLSNYQTDPADTRAQVAEINAYGPVKIVDFTTEINNMNVKFTATANGSPTGYSWTFENGIPATSTEQNPTVDFTVAGSNTVTCTASYAGGVTTDVSKEVIVRPFEIPRNNWTVAEVVDEEPAEDPNGWATNLFDGDLKTFWHTQWANQYTEFPHWVTVDMGRPYNLSAISWDQRETGTGRPKDIVINTSLDGLSFDETATATWSNDADQKVIFFDNVEAQFFQFYIASGYETTDPFSCGSELRAFGQNVVVYWDNPADIEIGTALSTAQLNATSNFPGTFVYTPAVDAKLGLGAHELSVEFTPDDGSLSPVTQTVMINVTLPIVSKAGWTVHFVDCEESSSEIATADLAIDGDRETFWHTQYDPTEPPYPHMLAIDMHETVNLSTLVIDLRGGNGRIADYEIWTSTTGTINGADTTLADGQWTMVASGTFEGEGDGPQTVELTPSDARYFVIVPLREVYDQNYAAIREISAYKSYNFTIPVITWAEPADILQGVALSATQLNATADVPGSFTYTPGLGTVLPAGDNQTLSVTFVPDDGVTYATVTKSVTINVIPTGINDRTSGSISIYPNPASDFITVTLSDKSSMARNTVISVIAANGKTLMVKTLGNSLDAESISIRSLAKGVYFIKMQSDASVSYQRFVKQ